MQFAPKSSNNVSIEAKPQDESRMAERRFNLEAYLWAQDSYWDDVAGLAPKTRKKRFKFDYDLKYVAFRK